MSKEYKTGNVVRRTADGKKVVLQRDVVDTEGKYEFVCYKPHEDGDYSYFCGSDYCRCMQ